MAEALDMGKYAANIWAAYGAFAVILGGLLITSLRTGARAKRELRDLEARQSHARRKPVSDPS